MCRDDLFQVNYGTEWQSSVTRITLVSLGKKSVKEIDFDILGDIYCVLVILMLVCDLFFVFDFLAKRD